METDQGLLRRRRSRRGILGLCRGGCWATRRQASRRAPTATGRDGEERSGNPARALPWMGMVGKHAGDDRAPHHVNTIPRQRRHPAPRGSPSRCRQRSPPRPSFPELPPPPAVPSTARLPLLRQAPTPALLPRSLVGPRPRPAPHSRSLAGLAPPLSTPKTRLLPRRWTNPSAAARLPQAPPPGSHSPSPLVVRWQRCRAPDQGVVVEHAPASPGRDIKEARKYGFFLRTKDTEADQTGFIDVPNWFFDLPRFLNHHVLKSYY
jgi:hypothetical protein